MGVHQLVSGSLPPSGIRVRLVKLGKGAKKLSKGQIIEILQLFNWSQSFQFVSKNFVNFMGKYLQLGNSHQHVLDLEEKFVKLLNTYWMEQNLNLRKIIFLLEGTRIYNSLCGKFRIFLPFRFYMKPIFENLHTGCEEKNFTFFLSINLVEV